jgi:hypothetical protein
MKKFIGVLVSLLFLSGCAYSPFSSTNHLTGSPLGVAIGAGIGGGSVAALGGTKPLIGFAAITGGVIGYYVTTLRYDSGGIMQVGGQVYKIGDFVGIYIPSDKLFEPNTADFLPQAIPILDSTVAVLNRYPGNNIIISGNTSGFSRSTWEQRISEERAKKVSAYLWRAGINQFKEQTTNMRQLNYVGYGDYLPISNDYTNDGIRQNSRIQITSYPTTCDLGLDKRSVAFHNFGKPNDGEINRAPDVKCTGGVGDCSSDNDP